jgi:hypothetical protein
MMTKRVLHWASVLWVIGMFNEIFQNEIRANPLQEPNAYLSWENNALCDFSNTR